jgi:hypothetical protein
MRKFSPSVFAVLVLFLLPVLAHAGNRTFGLGVVLGDPTGITAKGWLDKTHSIDGALAWDLSDNSNFVLQSTYLWQSSAIFHIEKQPFDLYYGIGGRLHGHSGRDHDTGVGLGPRGPLGLRCYFAKVGIETFTELSFTLELIPRTVGYVDFGIGARYFF